LFCFLISILFSVSRVVSFLLLYFFVHLSFLLCTCSHIPIYKKKKRKENNSANPSFRRKYLRIYEYLIQTEYLIASVLVSKKGQATHPKVGHNL
jgi:hypothetical protein